MTRWFILGCGYSGEVLARRLAEAGEAVVATTRNAERADALAANLPSEVTVVVGEPARTIAADGRRADVIVNSVPPSTSDGAPERAIAQAAADSGASRLVYLSSTGVYGRGADEWIDEDTPTGPLDERGARRLAAEMASLDAARERELEAVSLRIAGIYGPDRGVHARLAAGGYRVTGSGEEMVSRVHVEDLARAIIGAGRASPLLRSIYCIADDEPASSRDVADGIAALIGCAPPPSIAATDASASARAMLAANRRISNRRAKADLGLSLEFPSWREGVAALLGSSR